SPMSRASFLARITIAAFKTTVLLAAPSSARWSDRGQRTPPARIGSPSTRRAASPSHTPCHHPAGSRLPRDCTAGPSRRQAAVLVRHLPAGAGNSTPNAVLPASIPRDRPPGNRQPRQDGGVCANAPLTPHRGAGTLGTLKRP